MTFVFFVCLFKKYICYWNIDYKHTHTHTHSKQTWATLWGFRLFILVRSDTSPKLAETIFDNDTVEPWRKRLCSTMNVLTAFSNWHITRWSFPIHNVDYIFAHMHMCVCVLYTLGKPVSSHCVSIFLLPRTPKNGKNNFSAFYLQWKAHCGESFCGPKMNNILIKNPPPLEMGFTKWKIKNPSVRLSIDWL